MICGAHSCSSRSAVLPAADSFCDCVTLEIWEHSRARALMSMGGGWWSFKEVGCSLLVAVLKEETKGKESDSGIFLIPPSPLSLFLSYLVLGSKMCVCVGGGGR